MSDESVLHPRPSNWRALMKLGDIGDDVGAWLVVLDLDGYELSGPARTFTTAVHNATVSWQKARGLFPDGVVGAKTRARISMFPVVRKRVFFDPTKVPYIEAANWSRHLGAQPKRWIVLHSMEAAEASTTAERVASWFAGRNGPAPATSAHYCVDDDTVICCVPPERIAWHAPGANQLGIGIEHSGYARQTRTEWLDDFSIRMLRLSGELTAHLCRYFAIPIRPLVAADLRAGVAGITTHAEVTKAWPERGSHTDPGANFPMQEYLNFVREA